MREMRRKKQQLSKEMCEEILGRGTCGVLAVNGDDGYPYAVPLSYVYKDGVIYFHGAKVGYKIDAIAANDKASFCVVDKDEIVAAEYTTYFRSVIVTGKAKLLTDPEEMHEALYALAVKYAPNGTDEEHEAAIGREYAAVGVIALTVEEMTGKEAIELVRARQK